MSTIRALAARNLAVVWGFAAFFLPMGAAMAQVDYLVHPLLEGQGKQTNLPVPDSGKVPLSLTRSGSGAESIDLYLSSFGDQQGNSIVVSLEVAGQPKKTQLSLTLDRPVLPVTLDVPPLPSAGGFAGQLFLFRGQSLVKSYAIVLTRAAAAQYQVRPLSEDAAVQTTFTVSTGGNVTLLLTRSEGGPDSVSLQLSPFADERGNVGDVKLEIPEMPGLTAATRLDDVRVGPPVLQLRLVVADLPTPGLYKGQLFLIRQQSLLKSYSFALTRTATASKATLLLDQQAVNLSHTRWWPWSSRGPEFTVHLREASGEWPLEGLLARLESVQAPAGGLDLGRDLQFSLNDSPVADFWRSAPAPGDKSDRRAPPGQQVAVRGRFQDLEAGEYTAKIRFTALNSQADDRQLLTLNLKVRDSWIWAVLALFIAAAISFVSTKILRQREQRLQFLQRIDDARPDWLQREPPTLAIVWTRAFLRLTEQLCGKFLLAGSDVINTRIGQIEQVLKKGGPLERISILRSEIARLQYPMVVRRAQKCLNQICDRLGTPPLDEKLLAEIGSELDALNAWCDQANLPEHYWKDLKPDIDKLLGEVQDHIDVFPESVRPVVRGLIHELQAPPSSRNLGAMVERENAYAALNLLWERRNMPEVLADIAALQHQKHPIEELFEIADQDAWQRLQAAKNELHLRGPMRESPEPFEAYQLLRFVVAPADPWLRANYLFQHGLEYRWNIQIRRKTWLRKSPKPAPEEALTPVTHEPRVMQYAPWPGRLTASVTLVFRGQEIELPTARPAHQEIDTSRVFRWRQAFNRMEYLSSFLTLIVGIATGLSTYYFGNATFGSGKDYLTLLLWGAGADQAKNFVQLLGASAPGGETPQAKH